MGKSSGNPHSLRAFSAALHFIVNCFDANSIYEIAELHQINMYCHLDFFCCNFFQPLVGSFNGKASYAQQRVIFT